MHMGTMGSRPAQSLRITTLAKPVSATCATAVYGNYAATYERNCWCTNDNISIVGNTVTFNVAAQQNILLGSRATLEIISQTRGYLTAPNTGTDACQFNWSIVTQP